MIAVAGRCSRASQGAGQVGVGLGWRATAALHTVHQHFLALGTQGANGAGGVVDQELQVWVGRRAVVDQPELDVLGLEPLGTDAAQADHRVVAARMIGPEYRVVSAEPDTVVVRVPHRTFASPPSWAA